jgi:hypothetical protein
MFTRKEDGDGDGDGDGDKHITARDYLACWAKLTYHSFGACAMLPRNEGGMLFGYKSLVKAK